MERENNKKIKADKNSHIKNQKNHSKTKKVLNDKKEDFVLDALKIFIHEAAVHFGPNVEICIHDLRSKDLDHTVVYIENGHITNRKIGDAPSKAFFENKYKIESGGIPTEHLCYTTRTTDGKYLKSSTSFVKDEKGEYRYMICINQDISTLISTKNLIDSLVNTNDKESSVTIETNVNDLLESLISKSIALIGKVPGEMTKEEKKKAIKFLDDAGAFLITGSGDIITKCFLISKFTLYTYINMNKK